MNDSPHDGASFHGDGPMAALMRSHDWSNSKLGPPAQWPAELLTLGRLMLASSNPAVIVWSRACLFLYNDAYAPLLGARHPGALGQSFPLAWLAPWRAIEPIPDDALAGNAGAFDDVPALAHGGRQRWFSWSYTPVRNAAGEVLGMFNTGIETTARVMGEHKREFEHALTACLRNMNNPDQISAVASALLGERLRAGRVGYADVDHSGHWVTMKADWTDGSAPSMAGQLQHIDDFGPEIQAALGNGELLRIDDVARDPRTAPYAAAYAALHIGAVLAIPLLQHGGLRAILSVHQAGPRTWTDLDVALARQMVEHTWAAVEAARAHSELRQEQEQSRYILDNMDEGFALIDQDWTVLDVNTIAAQLCRMTREQLVGRSQWEAVPELLATPVEALYRRVHATRKSEVIEHHHTYPGGRQAWIEIRVYPSLLGRLAIFFRDISKRKAVEHEVADASRRKDEFLAMLAHELRNPLAPIGAAADLRSFARLDQERIRKTSAVISRQVKHMTSLVDDLLDVSRVTSGLVTLEQLPQDAGRVVQDAIEQVRPLIDARRQHLSLVLPPQPAYVRGTTSGWCRC